MNHRCGWFRLACNGAAALLLSLGLTACTSGAGGGGGAASDDPFEIIAKLFVGDEPLAAACDDFDHDNNQDIATANATDDNVAVLLGNGHGEFSAAQTYAIMAGAVPSMLVAVDLNEDDDIDLAVVDQANGVVSVLYGDGFGAFGGLTNFAVGDTPVYIAVGDFNGDDVPDLVVSNFADDTVSVLLNDGMGDFTATAFNTGDGPLGLVVEDFNNDNDLDVAVVNNLGENITVLLGAGDGTFTAAVFAPVTGENPRSVAAADFDADGNVDLAVTNRDDNEVGVLFGDGDGTFDPMNTYSAGSNPGFIAAIDLNLDELPDLVFLNATGRVSVRLGKTGGDFGGRTSAGTSGAIGIPGFGDFDEDGQPDIAIPDQDDAVVTIFLNQTTAAAP